MTVFLYQLAKNKPEFAKLIKENKEEFEKIIGNKVKCIEKIEDKDLKFSSQTFNQIREKLKMINRFKEKKREEIKVKFQEEELERMRKSFTKFEENCMNKLKFLVDHTLSKYKCKKKIEDLQLEKEKNNAKNKQKQTIIENIRNYYDDKLQMFKEKLTERRTSKALLDYEQKQTVSLISKIQKQRRKEVHDQHIQLIQQKVENAKLEFETEEESVCSRIIQQYKSSSKSIKRSKS